MKNFNFPLDETVAPSLLMEPVQGLTYHFYASGQYYTLHQSNIKLLTLSHSYGQNDTKN